VRGAESESCAAGGTESPGQRQERKAAQGSCFQGWGQSDADKEQLQNEVAEYQ
jgi:hypothetical protein